MQYVISFDHSQLLNQYHHQSLLLHYLTTQLLHHCLLHLQINLLYHMDLRSTKLLWIGFSYVLESKIIFHSIPRLN